MNKYDKVPESIKSLYFQKSNAYACAYLPGRRAASEVALPILNIGTADYSVLVRQGFRRSSMIVYRPACAHCNRCISLRIPVNDFYPNRTQRRLLKRHQDIELKQRPLVFDEAHYQLYQHYQHARHANGGMDCDSREEYEKTLLQSNVDSCLLEFSRGDQVKLVCVTDILEDGLSAVYTFFDPDDSVANWGTYGILRQIELCRADWLSWLYLGYWIEDCRKMAYKGNFRPAEILVDAKWRELAS